jgi:rod shape-determining protein MreD
VSILRLSLVTLIAVAAVLGLLLQTTVLHMLPLGRPVPDFILILCVYLGLHQHSIGGTTAAFLLGYFADNFSGNTVGLHAFAMTLVFVLVYLVSRRLWMDHWVSNVAVVFLASVLKTLTVAFLLVFYLSEEYPIRMLFAAVWLDAALAALFAPLVFVVLDRGRRASGLD